LVRKVIKLQVLQL